MQESLSTAEGVSSQPVSKQEGQVQEGLSGLTSKEEFKPRTVRGGAAAVLGQGLGMVIQICSIIVLTRLLSPTDYGIQGMVLAVTNFVGLFHDVGLGTVTIQREDMSHEQTSALFWINTAVGTALAILVAALGPVLVSFYGEPRLLWVTVASASLFILNGVGIQHRALLSRAMRFTTIAKIDLATQALGTCLAIGMAALGFGYWALVWQAVSSTAAAGIAMWIVMPWRPSRPGRTAGVRSMVRLGGTVTANGFVVYLAYNAEKVLLGRFWGAEALGIYGRAYQLATLPVQQLINAIGSVAFPVLSRMQNDPERFHRSFLKFHSIVVSLIVPVVVSCGLFGEEIVGVLFGPKWNGVGAVLRLLSPTALVFALINPFYWLLISTGRAGRSLKIAFLLAPAVLLGIAAGLRNGPTGVALGYSAAMVALIVPTVAWSKHETGVTNATYWDAIKRPLVAGAIGGAAGWCFKAFIATGMSPIPLMLGELTVSCAVYALVLLVVLGQKTLFAELLSQLMQKAQPVPSEV